MGMWHGSWVPSLQVCRRSGAQFLSVLGSRCPGGSGVLAWMAVRYLGGANLHFMSRWRVSCGTVFISLYCDNLFVGAICVWVAIARVLAGLVGARFSGVLAAPCLEICCKGRGIIRCILQVLLSSYTLGHKGVLL